MENGGKNIPDVKLNINNNVKPGNSGYQSPFFLLLSMVVVAIGIRWLFLSSLETARTPHPLTAFTEITVSNLLTGEETKFMGALKSGARLANGIEFLLENGKEKTQPYDGYRTIISGDIIEKVYSKLTDEKYNVEVTIKNTGKTEQYKSVKISENPYTYIPYIMFLSEDGTATVYSKSDVVIKTEEL